MVYIMNIRLLFFYMNERLFSCCCDKKTTYGTLVHFVENIIKTLCSTKIHFVPSNVTIASNSEPEY